MLRSLLSVSTHIILNRCKYLRFSICLAGQKCFGAFKNVIAIPAHLVGNPVILGRLPGFHIYMYTKLGTNMYFSTFCCPLIPNEMELLRKNVEVKKNLEETPEKSFCFLLKHTQMDVYKYVCISKDMHYIHTFFFKYIMWEWCNAILYVIFLRCIYFLRCHITPPVILIPSFPSCFLCLFLFYLFP